MKDSLKLKVLLKIIEVLNLSTKLISINGTPCDAFMNISPNSYPELYKGLGKYEGCLLLTVSKTCIGCPFDEPKFFDLDQVIQLTKLHEDLS